MKRAMLSAVLMYCTASANARIYDLGTLVPGTVYTISETNLAGAFNDLITFSTTN